MFLPREVLFAVLIFQLIQSGLSTTSITPSPSLSTPSANSTVPASSNSTTQAPSPSSQSSNVSPTTSVTAAAVSPGGGSGGGTSSTGSTNVTMVTPSPSSTVTISASSVKDVVWSEWRLEKPNDCEEKCCKTGGVVNQVRNCTINVKRCNLTLCENYGVIKKEVLCRSACTHCSSGRFVAGSALTIFIALLFPVLLTK